MYLYIARAVKRNHQIWKRGSKKKAEEILHFSYCIFVIIICLLGVGKEIEQHKCLNFVNIWATCTVWSVGFLYKVAPPKLKISLIMYFVMYNWEVLSKILKIVLPLEHEKTDFYSIKLVILIIIDTAIFNILDNTTEL